MYQPNAYKLHLTVPKNNVDGSFTSNIDRCYGDGCLISWGCFRNTEANAIF